MRRTIIILFILSAGIKAFSQDAADTAGVLKKIYTLGEVSVSAVVDRNSVSSSEMLKYNSRDVSSALRIVPSVIFSENASRNESAIYLRGFDIRSVPIYMDGIPVYVPYDGYIDLGRFTTGDLSKIDVSKGFSSMTYGANTIGGAINLVGLKPSEKLEINARAGVMSGKGYESRINLGSRLGSFYFQGGFSLLDRKYTPLSASFDTIALQKDHQRDNSYQKDIKGSVKVGYTPNATDEYSLNYIYSHGEKGNPVYLGSDKNTRVRYWQWPYWDKQSLYYISNTRIGNKTFLKARGYYDQFKNKLSSFDDNSYSTQKKGYAFNSLYNDHSVGGNLELNAYGLDNNKFRASLHFKNDNHTEHNLGEPVRHFSDNTWSLGVEDVMKAGNKLRFIPGLSYNVRKSLKAEDYNSTDKTISQYPANRNDALNAQLATQYDVSQSFNLSFNIAWKSRFATMKDRYSYHLGLAIPNPDLKSETALNLELGSTYMIGDLFKIRPELFLSRLGNTIQMVSNVQGDLTQMQNTGRSEFKGLDLTVSSQPVSALSLYVTYSYIHRKNLSNPSILFTDVPDNKLFASAEYIIARRLSINLSGEFDSERNNASDGTRVSPSFFVLNSQVSFRFAKYLTAEAGINNIFDRNYTIQEGYPEPGRNFYAALCFDLQRKPYDR